MLMDVGCPSIWVTLPIFTDVKHYRMKFKTVYQFKSYMPT
jgi:hypothetical protein